MRFKGQTDNQSRLTLPRRRVYLSIAFACTTAFAVAGCKNTAGGVEDQNDGGLVFQTFFFQTPLGRGKKGKREFGAPRAGGPAARGGAERTSAELPRAPGHVG